MSKPDFRTLCADIVLASDAVSHDAAAAEGDFEAAIDNARTALDVQPEPVAPTDFDDKFRSWYSDRYGRSYVSLHGIALVECVEWTRFALARWGALAIQPVAVTNEELLEMASNALGYVHIRVDSKELEANGEELIAYARAVLARSLTPTIQPVPVTPTNEEIEEAAKLIYASMRFAVPGNHYTRDWVERGNSLMQDEARRTARIILTGAPMPVTTLGEFINTINQES